MWFNSKQREEPYLDLTWKRPHEKSCFIILVVIRFTQVLHGCRQLVSLDVGLSPATSATLVFSCQPHFGGRPSRETAANNAEEGGDDVKSSWPLRPGLHTCYNGRYSGYRDREMEPIPQSRPQFGLKSATRLHEGGIASNRGSAYRGEYVPGPCTHRPSSHGRRKRSKS